MGGSIEGLVGFVGGVCGYSVQLSAINVRSVMFFLSVLHAGCKTRHGLEKALENFRLALTH